MTSRLEDQEYQKLIEIMDKLVTEETVSFNDKFRLFIDKLYKLVIEKPVQGELPSTGVKSAVIPLTSEQAQNEKPYDYPACVYRTLLPDGDILCQETHKLPLLACITRQKRYLHFERQCRPIGSKPSDVRRKTQPTRKGSFISKDSDYYCGLKDRIVPKDRLPTEHCLTCPNIRCKEAVQNLMK